MSDPTIPATVVKAAKRGFIRTTAQAYAATLSGGISATAILSVIHGEVDLLSAGITLGVAVVTPPIAGLVAFLNILSAGVPKEYTAAAADQGIGGGQ